VDITITYRDGWALLEFADTGRTALCLPHREEGPPESLNFEVVGWHDTYDDAYHVVAAMSALDFTVEEFLSARGSEAFASQEEEQPPPTEARLVTSPRGDE
jgi:hypothetical protein